MTRQSVLVDADWVERHLDDPRIALVEVDEDTAAYDRGHLRGATTLDWTRDLQDQVNRDVVGPARFAELMRERGIERDRTVVIYGGNNNWFASFAYWLFRLYGHPDVRLLDGGRKKWEADDRELVEQAPQPERSDYPVPTPDPAIRAFRDDVLAAIGRDNLIDTRSVDEYAGRLLAPAHLPQEHAQRPGHIPTALNVPWSRTTNDDGTFKPVEELSAIYARAGLDPSRPTITYCRIGERSSHTWFVLHELLGQADVRNYDGSWTEYGSLVGVPVERSD